MSNADLTSAAMSLSPDERAELAYKLISSLDALGQPVAADEWRRSWAKEIVARVEAVRAGTEPVFDADEVFDELEAELDGRPGAS
jgi:putative addiction module component (TIGR02574 family)